MRSKEVWLAAIDSFIGLTTRGPRSTFLFRMHLTYPVSVKDRAVSMVVTQPANARALALDLNRWADAREREDAKIAEEDAKRSARVP